ncbi:hypothetical protein D3C75_862020 [compost metagenome]
MQKDIAKDVLAVDLFGITTVVGLDILQHSHVATPDVDQIGEHIGTRLTGRYPFEEIVHD